MEAVTLAWEDCDHFEWPICRNLVHSSGNIKKKLVTAESEGYLLLKVDQLYTNSKDYSVCAPQAFALI